MESVGDGEGGKIWENGIETCILSCMNLVTSPVSMHWMHWMLGAGALGQPRGMVWGGRMEEGSGWGDMYTCGVFISIFDKTNTIL